MREGKKSITFECLIEWKNNLKRHVIDYGYKNISHLIRDAVDSRMQEDKQK